MVRSSFVIPENTNSEHRPDVFSWPEPVYSTLFG